MKHYKDDILAGNGKQISIVRTFMKKTFPAILSVLLFFSCKKDSNLFLNNRFKGVWEFENFSGYPFNNNYLPPGNGRIMVLSADGSYERRQHDTVLFRGRYFLKKQKDCFDEEKKIHFYDK